MFDKGWTGLFKQATQMQSKLAEIQKGLADKTIEVSTGGGMVKVVANGLNEIISVKIDDELINMNDREVLEDLITGAVNEASKKVKEMAQEEMTKITGGVKIPGLFPPT
jgi:nucleoid-associated protein EbfC